MKYLKEYQEWRKFKKFLRDKNILKPLKYKKGDKVVLKDDSIGEIYKVNKYDINPIYYMGNYKKDYLLTKLYRLGNSIVKDDSEFNWQKTIDENEIDHEKTKFLNDIEQYNL